MSLLFFKEKPKTPPSATSDEVRKESLLGGIKALLKNSNFVLLSFCFCAVMVTTGTGYSNLAVIFAPFGFEPVITN